MLKKIICILASLLIIIAFTTSASADKSKWPKSMLFAGGRVGSGIHAHAVQLANIMNKLGVATSVITGSSGTNALAIDRNQAQIGYITNYDAYTSMIGVGVKFKDHPTSHLRSIFQDAFLGVYIAVRADNKDIHSIDDLKDKHLAMPPAKWGATSYVIPLLKKHGITKASISQYGGVWSEAGLSEQGRGIADGTFDAMFMTAPPWTLNSALFEFEETKGFRFVPLSQEDIQTLLSIAPFLSEGYLPPGIVKSQKEPYHTAFGGVNWYVNDSIPADLINEFLKAVWAQRADIVKNGPMWGYSLTKDEYFFKGVLLPCVPPHPGAIMFRDEMDLEFSK